MNDRPRVLVELGEELDRIAREVLSSESSVTRSAASRRWWHWRAVPVVLLVALGGAAAALASGLISFGAPAKPTPVPVQSASGAGSAQAGNRDAAADRRPGPAGRASVGYAGSQHDPRRGLRPGGASRRRQAGGARSRRRVRRRRPRPRTTAEHCHQFVQLHPAGRQAASVQQRHDDRPDRKCRLVVPIYRLRADRHPAGRKPRSPSMPAKG